MHSKWVLYHSKSKYQMSFLSSAVLADVQLVCWDYQRCCEYFWSACVKCDGNYFDSCTQNHLFCVEI